jgi:8-oxo-dGTP pyrophosphatase MutT (NUDIX family)
VSGDISSRRPAAVLVPVYDGPGGPTLVFIRRTTRVNHPGQVAFPGGRPEPGDRDLLQTALREAHEEVGLNPGEVTIVGALPVVETVTSNYAIASFVGRLLDRAVLRPQPEEVDAILDVPLEALLAPGMPLDEEWDVPVSMDPPSAAPRLGPGLGASAGPSSPSAAPALDPGQAGSAPENTFAPAARGGAASRPDGVSPAPQASLPAAAVQRRRVRYYPWGDDRIWGATQRIVEHLLAAVHRGDLTL